MKLRIAVIPLLLSALCCGALAQEKTEPQLKLVQFYFVLVKKGPQWPAQQSNKQLNDQHIAYVMGLLQSGKAIAAGPFADIADNGDLLGIYIFRAQSLEEAKSWANGDPTVISGQKVAEVHPWWSEDVMKKPAAPIKMEKAYLGLLTRGEKWTAEKTPQTEELQKAHLANINRLAQLKKLVVAGPFGDDGVLRGIFVFRVASLDEAKTLAATDPAVQAGRLAIELHPWLVPVGILP
jgi:uncharacterized protein YciI